MSQSKLKQKSSNLNNERKTINLMVHLIVVLVDLGEGINFCREVISLASVY